MTSKKRVAIVTGSARNIGKAIAINFAKSAIKVVLNGRTMSDELLEVHQYIQSIGGDSYICEADISSESGAKKLIEATVEHFGQIDILVNNAALRRHSSFADLDYSAWKEVIQTILDGAY